MEFLAQFWDEITILGVIVVAALSLRSGIERNTRAIEDHTQAVQSLKGAIIKNEERMVAAMEKAAMQSTKEHDALLAAIDRFATQQTERHEKLLEAMNRDHRDMNKTVGDIAQTTSKTEALLTAHMGEDRAR
ncbi:MAG: hypothetical protein F4Y03_02580 [Alphaproteobacteria bacterium]|nr:hypothetical protein [Alphaproteobacteria bacterium]